MKIQICCALLCAVCTLSVANTKGVVNANVLNVRNRPDAANSTVVAKLKQGDTVNIVKQSGEWLEIAAPASAGVYVFGKFVEKGRTTRDVNLRAGAGVEFQSYGIIPTGTEVRPVGDAQGDWMRIEPLTTMTCFVSSKFVKVEETPADKPAPKTPASDASAVGAADKSDAGQTASLEDSADMKTLRAILVKDSAQEIKVEGYLCKVKSKLSPIGYALVGGTQKPEVLYYVFGAVPSEAQLKTKVAVKGTCYTINDWRKPVLEAKSFEAVK